MDKITLKEFFGTDKTGIDFLKLMSKFLKTGKRPDFKDKKKNEPYKWRIKLFTKSQRNKINPFEINNTALKIDEMDFKATPLIPYEISYPEKEFYYRMGSLLTFYKVKSLDPLKEFLKTIDIRDSTIAKLVINSIEDDSYEYIHQKFSTIIKSVTSVNLVILIYPFDIDPNPETLKHSPLIISPTFDIDKDTYGIRIEFDSFKKGTSTNITYHYFVLLKSESSKLHFGLNLKELNRDLDERKPKSALVKGGPSEKTDSFMKKNIEVCNGEEIIPEDYFDGQWDKIIIQGIKEGFNEFLLEPYTGRGIRKSKLYSLVSKDGIQIPSRFIGYFKGPGTDESGELKKCQIIWETDWEKEYLNSFQSSENMYVSEERYIANDEQDNKENLSKKWDKYIKALNNKLKKIDHKETLQVFNVLGDGNCLFYAMAQTLMSSDISIDKGHNEINKPEYRYLDGEFKPIYENFAKKLRDLVKDVLKKSFEILHTELMTYKSTNPDYDGTSYPIIYPDNKKKQNAMSDLFLERIAAINTNSDEDIIHNGILEYIDNISYDMEYGSNLELRALSSFFKIDIETIVLEGSGDTNYYKISKEDSIIQFPVEGIIFNESDSPSEDENEKIYLALTPNKHYMSVLPESKLTMTSYNYLFQKGDLSVGIKKNGKDKVHISDFHDSGKYAKNMEFLESGHNYIQWLFPIKAESYFGPSDSQKYIYWKKIKIKSPIQLKLTDEDIKLIKEDKVVIFNSIKSFVTMLRFYGFKFEVSSGNFGDITNLDDFNTNIKNITIEKLSDAVFKERFKNLLQNEHNYKRITRILKYFKLIGFKKINTRFLKVLKSVIFEEDNEVSQEIKNSYNTFWKKEL